MIDLTFSSAFTFPTIATSTTSSTQMETEADWRALLFQHIRQATPAVWQKVRNGFSLQSIIEIDQSTVLPSQMPRYETVDATIQSDLRIQAHVDAEHFFAHLEELALAQDYHAFQAAVADVNWTRHSPAILTRTIQMALSHEWLSLAETLLRQGRELFPEDHTLRRISHTLAPPAISVLPGEAPHGLAASRAWLRTQATAYRGQWVAIYNGQLLGAAPSLNALHAVIDPIQQPSSTIITHIL